MSPATIAIASALKAMGIFFEAIDCGWVDARATVTLFREEDAREVACWFATAGWHAQAEGRRVLAWVGAA